MRSRTLMVGLACMALAALAFSISGRSQKPEEQQDSTQMKLIKERVRVTVKTRAQYEFLKGMVVECPPFDSTRGEPWEFVVNQWQRTQLEKQGIRVRVLREPKAEQGPNQMEYELVKEFDLTDDGVGTVVFGPKSNKSSALSEIILGLKNKEVFVYDSDFKLIRNFPLHRPTFSRNLRYFGGINYVKIPSIRVDSLLRGDSIVVEETVTYEVRCNFELFDHTGNKLWELGERQSYEVNPTYSISNKGTVIELDHGTGVVTFLDKNGEETKTSKVCNSQGTPGEGIGGGLFSGDGDCALIVADQFCPDTLLGGKVRVLFFSWDGEELWRFNTEENTRDGASISKFGNYVIVSCSVWPSSNYPRDIRRTYLFSNNGELLMKYENVSGGLICFSSSEKYALFHSPHEGEFLIDLPSGEVLLNHGRKGGFHQVSSLDIAEDAKIFGFIACHPGTQRLVKEKEGNIEVKLMGFEGLKVWSDIFPSPDYRSLSPVNLRLSDDAKEMLIQIGSRIMIYQQVD